MNSYDVLPFSTGVIGRPLPMDKIRTGLRGIRSELKPDNLKLAAEAIMTTDQYPKYFSCQVGSAVIAGIAKGAGMGDEKAGDKKAGATGDEKKAK